jgi:predicted MPP superfamily phosphohydrolase
LLGDYIFQGVIGDQFTKPKLIIDKLGNLKASKGIIAILGNHDWWYDGDKITSYLENKKITILENNAVKIKYTGKYFWVAGVGDLWTRPVKITNAVKNIKDDNPIILLSHNPDIFPSVPSRISLTLSGHTHGGQVYVPFMGRIITPSDYGKRYARGHIIENNRHLFVSSGIGTTILPVRFGTPPEIIVLHLKSK